MLKLPGNLKDSLNIVVSLDNKYKDHMKKWQKAVGRIEDSQLSEKIKKGSRGNDTYRSKENINSNCDKRERLMEKRNQEEIVKQQRMKEEAERKKTERQNKCKKLKSKKNKILSLNKNEVLKGIIYSEILGEPKSLRKR